MDSEELLKKADEYLKKEGVETKKSEISNEEALNEFILPGLQASKDILSTIYSFHTREKSGIGGKIKNFIQNKIIFTVINVIEKQSMRQQKFNELTYKAIGKLVEENKELKDKLKIKRNDLE